MHDVMSKKPPNPILKLSSAFINTQTLFPTPPLPISEVFLLFPSPWTAHLIKILYGYQGDKFCIALRAMRETIRYSQDALPLTDKMQRNKWRPNIFCINKRML